MKKLKPVMHFVISAVTAFICASIFQTQMVIASLADVGANVGLGDRLFMTGQDVIGLSLSYGLVVLAGLLVAFLVTKAIRKFSPAKSKTLYVLAGALAMLVILLAMQPILGVTLLGGARTNLGVVLQMLAGAIGGFVFMILRNYDAINQET